MTGAAGTGNSIMRGGAHRTTGESASNTRTGTGAGNSFPSAVRAAILTGAGGAGGTRAIGEGIVLSVLQDTAGNSSRSTGARSCTGVLHSSPSTTITSVLTRADVTCRASAGDSAVRGSIHRAAGKHLCTTRANTAIRSSFPSAINTAVRTRTGVAGTTGAGNGIMRRSVHRAAGESACNTRTSTAVGRNLPGTVHAAIPTGAGGAGGTGAGGKGVI